jgi:hypothetical protein
VFQVTKRGLDGAIERDERWDGTDALFLVGKRGRDLLAHGEGTEEGIKGVEAMLGRAEVIH